MSKAIKALHLIGVIMFFGSILGHITVGLVPGVADDPNTALFAREAIAVATTYLTLPGLALALLSGIYMAAKRGGSVFRTRWLMLHALFGTVIVLNAALVLYPIGQELLEAALQVAKGALPIDQLGDMAGREAAFGAVNVVLCLVMVFVAVVKPRIGQPKL